MAETEAPAKGEAKETKPEGTNETPPVDSDIEAIAGKAENPDAVRNALTAEREAAKEARKQADEYAKKVKAFEDKDKSETEKLASDKADAEARAEAAERKLLKREVAAEKELPANLADRLQGKTKKELEADADRLLELVKPAKGKTVDVDAGKGTGTGAVSFNDVIRKQAGAR